jgi:hypothetical protein
MHFIVGCNGLTSNLFRPLDLNYKDFTFLHWIQLLKLSGGCHKRSQAATLEMLEMPQATDSEPINDGKSLHVKTGSITALTNLRLN